MDVRLGRICVRLFTRPSWRPFFSRKYTGDRVWFALSVVIVLVICVALYIGWRNCRERGGTYVRGLFWLECVK
jgi:hypothetical protein